MSAPVHSAGPELIVIGAMKSGSTSLHRYLDKHPQIAMARDKELNFFLGRRNWDRGVAWYRRQFAAAPVRGETSPNYTKFPTYPGVPQRIAEVVPEVKLIYVLREPVERTLSHFHHNLADGLERRPLEEALLGDVERNHYLACSRYRQQLGEYLRVFDREQIHVVLLEDLSHDLGATMHQIFEFLGVDTAPAERLVPHVANPRAARRKTALRRWMASQRGATRLRRAAPKAVYRAFDRMTTRALGEVSVTHDELERLRELLRPDARDLEEHLGRSLPWPTLRGETR